MHSPDPAPKTNGVNGNGRHPSPTLRFMAGVIRKPFSTGAIAPTSHRAARRIIAMAGVDKARNIIELGAGTGVLTREILARKTSDARVMTVERSTEFAEMLTDLDPGLFVVNDCATRLREHARSRGIERADCIVSALPWSLIPPADQESILREAAHMLEEGGTFITLMYYGPHWFPGGRRFRRLLESVFPSVRSNPLMLRNIPPAFVYQCSAANNGSYSSP